MKKRVFIILLIIVFSLCGCSQFGYGYSKGKKMALNNTEFFKEIVSLCIDNQLKQPIISGEITTEEYEKLDNNGKKILDKCITLNISNIYYNDYYDTQQKFDYIEICFNTPLAYQGVIYVPKGFSEEDVKNLIYQITYEPIHDLTNLDDNLYYYYTDEAIEGNYDKDYIFPQGSVEER